MERREIGQAELAQSLSVQQEACQHINKITESLKNFSYIPNTPGTWGYLDQAIENVVNLVDDVYARDGIEIKVTAIDRPIKVSCKTDLIQQVLFNLFKNAYDAVLNRQQRDITVEVKLDSKNAIIAFKDTGFGIDDKKIEHIFDNFFTTKEYGKGSGLGLYIAKSIVNACGGSIRCESKIDEGSTFFVTLPLISQP